MLYICTYSFRFQHEQLQTVISRVLKLAQQARALQQQGGTVTVAVVRER